MSIHEQNVEIMRLLTEWGWLSTKVKSEIPNTSDVRRQNRNWWVVYTHLNRMINDSNLYS